MMKLNKTSIKFYELTNDDEGKIVLTPAGEIENKPARGRELVAEIERLEADNERLRDLLAKSIRREEIIEAENERLYVALKTISRVDELLLGTADDLVALCRDVALEAIKGEK
jgi:hypothetical protein